MKPKTIEELVDGIKQFWKTVTVQKCLKYINHLRKEIPKVIELEGAVTGYYQCSYFDKPHPPIKIIQNLKNMLFTTVMNY